MMKQLILVNGTMGVGKTTTCLELQKILPNNVFLDGDWCWKMSPFVVTDETKEMVLTNISCLLQNFLHCSAFDHIIFCWVMNEQSIVDEVLSRLDLSNCQTTLFSLICSEDALKRRIALDVQSGMREKEVVARALARLKDYERMSSVKVDVGNCIPTAAAEEIALKLQEKSREGR